RYSQNELDQIAHDLNTRPRKCLGYRTPIEVEQHGVALTA
ncbi:IS30 family transposase, partial [Auritidibacter sp. NML120779]